MEEVKSLDTSKYFALTNLAEDLDKDILIKIGKECSDGFERDLESRATWDEKLEEWTKLALQVQEDKNFPWPNAANVKYPLLSTAAMQFAARAYPSLIPSSGKLVTGVVIGSDPTGEKAKRAKRVSTYMSYQFMKEMDNWEEDQDKMMIMLPIVGCMFKKTFYNPVKEQITSDLVMPLNFVVDYWAKSLDDAERVSEIICLTKRQIEERKRLGLFLPNVKLSYDPKETKQSEQTLNVSYGTDYQDSSSLYEFIEQHTFWDVDEDGYSEPYIITFERSSGTVVRIVPRFEMEDIKLNKKGEIARITPTQYYTKYPFIPNPEGGFYDIGFGQILGSLNETANTLINQLLDAGTLNNLNGGFIGKGLKIKMGETSFSPGEWKAVNATGDDLKKQIVQLPSKEPSNVLFQLLGMVISSGKELASVAEIFVGKMPGQNTPATTTMASIEQGMKVFTAIYKRLYRALDKEFKKVFHLNSLYLDHNYYVSILDETINPGDFDNSSYDICPAADPVTSTQQEKMAKAQALLQMLPLGLDPIKVLMRNLEAMEQPNWEELIPGLVESGEPQVPQQPDPVEMEMRMKQEADNQSAQLKAQELEFKQALEQRSQEFDTIMEGAKQNQELRHKASMNALEANAKRNLNEIFIQRERIKNQKEAQKQPKGNTN